MKKTLAVALLSLAVQLAPAHAREAVSFKPWHSTQGISTAKPIRPLTIERPSNQHRPIRPLGNHSGRLSSLHQASTRLEQLQQKQHRLKREMRRAQQQHASRSKIARLRQQLRTVNLKLSATKKEYRHFLKLKLGSRQYSLMLKHLHWLGNDHGDNQHVGQWRPQLRRD